MLPDCPQHQVRGDNLRPPSHTFEKKRVIHDASDICVLRAYHEIRGRDLHTTQNIVLVRLARGQGERGHHVWAHETTFRFQRCRHHHPSKAQDENDEENTREVERH